MATSRNKSRKKSSSRRSSKSSLVPNRPPKKALLRSRRKSKNKPTRSRKTSKSKSNRTSKSRKRSRSKSNNRKQSKSRKQSKTRSRKQSKTRSRKQSKSKLGKRSKTRSRKRSKSRSKSRKTSIKGIAICIPAGNRVMDQSNKMFRPHLTLTYLKTDDMQLVNKIKKEIEIYVMQEIIPDKDERYMVSYDKTKIWGPNSVSLIGEIENFKQDLHRYLKSKYPDFISSYRPAHVNIRGLKKIKLYKSLNVQQLTIECE